MGAPKEPKPVKLFSGLIFKEKEILFSAQEKLAQFFGKIDFESDILPFDFTNYYKKEIGNNLKRKFISFAPLIPTVSLPEIKLKTNAIEKALSDSRTESRTVNIDPGYLSDEKVVLATTKNFSHRLYLSSGIFGELTYFYMRGSYRTLEWTYPDFKTPERVKMFNNLRNTYISKK